MSIVFQCPHCGTERTAAHYVLGRRVRCPDCGEMVEVTAEEAESNEDESDTVISSSNEPLPLPLMPVKEPPAHVVALGSETTEPLPEPASAFRKHREVVEAEMDMTPMVDVTFLLLIFFMVTAAFAVQKAKEIPKPEPQEEGAQSRTFQVLEDNPDYVTVTVDEFGAYRVTTVDWDRTAFSTTELLTNLKEARGGSANGQVPKHLLVKAHGSALHERVVIALDAGNDVGMDDVQLQTYEEED